MTALYGRGDLANLLSMSLPSLGSKAPLHTKNELPGASLKVCRDVQPSQDHDRMWSLGRSRKILHRLSAFISYPGKWNTKSQCGTRINATCQ